MSPIDTPINYRVWTSDDQLPDSSSSDSYLFRSHRIGGVYRIARQAAVHLERECHKVDPKEAERLKARLATLLMDRIKQGELIPVVDPTLVDYVCKKTKPLPVAKRARRLLRFVVESTSSLDESINVSQHSTSERTLGSCESTTITEVERLFQYLREVGFIEGTYASGYYRATVQGFETIEKEEHLSETSINAFVALWFDESTNDLRIAIEDAIHQAGYKPFIVDDQAFDGLIDDAITAGIRAAKFVIVDLTHGKKGMRGSVYYEAGFARGLEKSVILTAQQDHVDDLKIAFDLNHYSIIKWSKEDLPKFSKELRARIEALFGKGPGA